jgi:hypothetical protein
MLLKAERLKEEDFHSNDFACDSVKSELISDPLELSKHSCLEPIPGIPDPLCLDRRATQWMEVRWRSAPRRTG